MTKPIKILRLPFLFVIVDLCLKDLRVFKKVIRWVKKRLAKTTPCGGVDLNINARKVGMKYIDLLGSQKGFIELNIDWLWRDFWAENLEVMKLFTIKMVTASTMKLVI